MKPGIGNWHNVDLIACAVFFSDLPASIASAVIPAAPGVMEGVSGHDIHDDAQYRHCWLIRFTDPTVIDSYRDSGNNLLTSV